MLSSIPHELIDPWILMVPSDLDTFEDQMLLSPAESADQAIQPTSPVMFVTANGTTDVIEKSSVYSKLLVPLRQVAILETNKLKSLVFPLRERDEKEAESTNLSLPLGSLLVSFLL